MPENLERVKGFEPSTPTLARLCSTPELHPRRRMFITGDRREFQGEKEGEENLAPHSKVLLSTLQPPYVVWQR